MELHSIFYEAAMADLERTLRPIIETYVFGEILKSYYHNGREPAIYLYRDADKREIDFVLEENNTLYPIEVKKSANPGLNDCRSFGLLARLNKNVGMGAVICLQLQRIPLSREVVSIPVGEI